MLNVCKISALRNEFKMIDDVFAAPRYGASVPSELLPRVALVSSDRPPSPNALSNTEEAIRSVFGSECFSASLLVADRIVAGTTESSEL
jgi:hypothetical protein